MTKNNCLLNEGIIQVGEKIYKIIDGSDGYLSLFSATLDSEFSPVETNGDVPTNRYKYACIPSGKSHFLLLGGDSETINEFEIWKFNVKANEWTLLENMSDTPIKRRYGHSVAFSPQNPKSVLYIFGGIRGIEVCHSLIIITLNSTGYTYENIEHGKGWPCPRYFSTMITMQNTIWVFGGTGMNSNKLNDLWEMDHSIFDSQPRWINHPAFPPARDCHISWAEKGDLFIAGGFNDKGFPLNDIWKYSKDRWEQTMIFESEYPIYRSTFGLCEISNTLTLAKERSPFAGLDILFNKLRLKQRVYTEQSIQDEKTLQELHEQSLTLKTQCEALEQYSKDKKRTKEIDDVVNMFSEERRNQIQTQTKQVRLQLSANTKDIINNLPSAIKVESILAKPKVRTLSMMLSLKEKQDSKRMETLKAEREMEIEIYKSQLKRLETQCKYDITKLPNIDTSNFSTFEEFSETLKAKERGYALTLYYGMQLREYQRLLCESQLLNEKITKIEKNQLRYIEVVNHLSKKLTKKFAKVAALQEDLDNWKKYLSDAEKDCEQVNAYLEALKEYLDNPQQLKSKVEVAKKQNAQLQEQLQQELSDIVVNKKEVIKQMFKATQELSEQIKSQTSDEAHSAIVEALPSLNYYLSYIVSATN
ncbi:leucine-zipper-like transcriptional regulator 1 [Histomonas meleagridis]|uniref:leucine-zipper-like transcriptional regulator 1-like n=1 Tax=Histomonas meleagridis TaxID=135588 RepID=UPI00355A02AC|nr:leucine-zipper-like transcriptional regulator 1 [Histomonas meleagridis]KAH0805665.1 leucine-zipper-like transcriptional regulator 1-like [Histomonas meleagridis]